MAEKTLTDELTGNSSIQTDHGELEFGDLVVLILDLVLLVYTGWRSYDFLSTTVPDGWQMLALVGLWGLDIGAIAWSLVWIFGSTEKYQDWTAMAFFVIDLIGVILTSITDSLMYGAEDGAMTSTLTGVATVAVPLVVVGNVVAGFIYHMTSPQTKARREDRRKQAEHNRKMREITQMDRDLQYAESYLLAKQETLEKAVVLAEIKTAQDALEKATRSKLRDQVGIHAASKGDDTPAGAANSLDRLKAHLESLKQKLASIGGGDQTPDDSQAPAEEKSVEPPVSNLPAPQLTPVPAGVDSPSGAVDPDAVKGNGHANSDPL